MLSSCTEKPKLSNLLIKRYAIISEKGGVDLRIRLYFWSVSFLISPCGDWAFDHITIVPPVGFTTLSPPLMGEVE